MLFDLDVFKTEILIHPQPQISLDYFSFPTFFFSVKKWSFSADAVREKNSEALRTSDVGYREDYNVFIILSIGEIISKFSRESWWKGRSNYSAYCTREISCCYLSCFFLNKLPCVFFLLKLLFQLFHFFLVKGEWKQLLLKHFFSLKCKIPRDWAKLLSVQLAISD